MLSFKRGPHFGRLSSSEVNRKTKVAEKKPHNALGGLNEGSGSVSSLYTGKRQSLCLNIC